MSSFEWYLMMSGDPMSWRNHGQHLLGMEDPIDGRAHQLAVHELSDTADVVTLLPGHVRSVLQPRVETGLALGDRMRRHLLVKIVGLTCQRRNLFRSDEPGQMKEPPGPELFQLQFSQHFHES